ncbi:hypothetical protein E4U27_004442 [Claviceps purpurea]|nr:hypothetical protein E4U27_004442 [Claviceps purpurea]KAG6258464.1 hypothetical protein E4U49_006337 [Claviceps purpurea]
MIITSEQQDLEGGLQNLSLNPGPSTTQPGPSEGAPNLEDLHPSLEQYRKHIAPAWKDVTEDSDVEDVTETNDYIIYHFNYYVQHSITHANASKPIRPYARDYLLDNGVTLDSNVRKIGDKLVALVQQNHEALTTRYSESLKRSDSQLDLNHPANRSASPLSYHKATRTAARRPASVHAPSDNAPSVHVPASANPSAACTTPREKEDISDKDPSADDPVEEESQQTKFSQSPSPALNLVITGSPHRRREAAALPDKDWRSDDLATNEDPLTNTDHLLDEEIANPRGEGSDFTFEEPIRIDKKAPTVLRNGNDGAQPQKQERQKEKTLRGEFSPAYQRTLSSPRII